MSTLQRQRDKPEPGWIREELDAVLREVARWPREMREQTPLARALRAGKGR